MIPRSLLSAFSTAVSLVAMTIGLICLVSPHRPLLLLIDIFTLPGLTGAAVWAAATWLLRQQPAKWIATGAVLVFVAAIWPQAFPHQAAPDRTKPPVRIVFANMLIRNHEPERILPWIAKENPDVVGMVEVNPFARQALINGLKHDHPYVVTRYDVVIASRYPLTAARHGDVGFSLLTATVKAPGGDVTFAVTHLTRPWPYEDPSDQTGQLSRLGHALQPLSGRRFVLVGDFNTPPCASSLQGFLRARHLHAAGALFGTWNTLLPGLLRVNIDNAIASPDLNLSHRHVGPFDGSDHRPIVVDIYPAKAG